MANFEQAYQAVRAHEGGYVNDPKDRGGETYRGISRRHHSDWGGWKRIDAAKRRRDFPNNLKADRYLPRMIKRFYKKYFWDRFIGDQLPDDVIATELLDTSVNVGVRRAVRFLQAALNLLNRNQRDYQDVSVDGLLGTVTLGVLNRHLKQDKTSAHLVKLMKIQQGEHYVEFMRQDPPQERFARGWLARV